MILWRVAPKKSVVRVCLLEKVPRSAHGPVKRSISAAAAFYQFKNRLRWTGATACRRHELRCIDGKHCQTTVFFRMKGLICS